MSEEEPETLEFLMDEVLRVREIKAELQKDMKEVEEYVAELEDAILKKFDEVGVKSVKDVSGNTFSHTVTASAVIEDYDAFTKYVMESGRIDLMQKRVMQSEVQKMFEDGESVPGIGLFTKIGLRIRKG